jgi:cytochrome c-type biogenesis protein CcmH
VLWPLSRGQAIANASPDADIYRDQLEEIERDRANGTLASADAEAARIEVSRRLLAAADREARVAPPAAARVQHRRWTAVAAFLLIPAGAVVVYLALGSPQLPGQPLAQRLEAPGETNSMAGMIARVETHLERNPEDGRGWEVIAPIYMRIGRFDEAIRAYRNTIKLRGDTAEREAALGEALASSANGIITADAKAAFEHALALDAGDPRAQFYLGLAAEQDGKASDAAERWRNLLAHAPAGAPWVASVREALGRVDPSAHQLALADTAPPPGPSAQDMAAAANMSSSERNEMVRGMVERLAARLATDGSDVDGWLRLLRAYMVLGERDKARAAVGDARRALAGEPDKLRRLDEAAKSFGIDG